MVNHLNCEIRRALDDLILDETMSPKELSDEEDVLTIDIGQDSLHQEDFAILTSCLSHFYSVTRSENN